MSSGHINLVYFSPSGTTKSVITTLAGAWDGERNEFDLLRIPPPRTVTFSVDSPAVFAVPVFAGRVPAVCADMLAKFKGQNTPAVAIVVYGNREYDDALLELTDILKANNFVVVAAAAFVAQHSIFPIVASERPDKKDKEAIVSFGKQCAKAIATCSGNEKIKVKGTSPYCKPGAIPLQPSGDSKCDNCGVCVEICPTKAIAKETPRKTDKKRCISCTACISVCPQKARAFHGPMYAIAGKAFAGKNSTRKEPEIFFVE